VYVQISRSCSSISSISIRSSEHASRAGPFGSRALQVPANHAPNIAPAEIVNYSLGSQSGFMQSTRAVRLRAAPPAPLTRSAW
jgi:hypothetical protein